MDFMKKTFDRAKQSVTESFGDADYTEYEAEFQAQLQRADDIGTYVEKIVVAVENYMQPDPAFRIKEGLSTTGLTEDALNKPEDVATQMGAFCKAISAWTGQPNFSHSKFADALRQGEDTFARIGKHEREYLGAGADTYVAPIKRFLEEQIKVLAKERTELKKLRLDMDSVKNKLRNKDPAQYPQLVTDKEKAEQAFNEQKTKVSEKIASIEADLPNHLKLFKKFVEVRIDNLKKTQKALEDLNKNSDSIIRKLSSS